MQDTLGISNTEDMLKEIKNIYLLKNNKQDAEKSPEKIMDS